MAIPHTTPTTKTKTTTRQTTVATTSTKVDRMAELDLMSDMFEAFMDLQHPDDPHFYLCAGNGTYKG